MKINLNRLDSDYLFEVSNSNGHSILLDNITRENPQAVSPMEALLMSMAGCSSIDMVSILKKQRQEITAFSAEITGDRVQVKEAKPFRDIHVVFFLEGDIDQNKADKAAKLSFEKYCSVSMSLDPQIKITWEVKVNKGK